MPRVTAPAAASWQSLSAAKVRGSTSSMETMMTDQSRPTPNDKRETLSDSQLDQVQGGQGISQQVKFKNQFAPPIAKNTGKSIAQGDMIDNEDNLPS